MAFQKHKVDPVLGIQIHEYLMSIGIETPLRKDGTALSEHQKIEIIEKNTRAIWETLGLDLSDDSLENTPNRIAKMLVLEMNYGLIPNNFPKCTTVENKMDAGMVIVKEIGVISNCEHHGVIIDGMATVAYIPKDKVLGLSKINRIVDYFARRPQIQERLTNQIWHALYYILDTDNIAVYIDAIHYCVKSRGAEDQTSHTITNKLGGAFKNDSATRAEFMSLCHN
jgi:GTP cyclohydrolase IA